MAVPDLPALVMLSLLPVWLRRLIGEPLRAGEAPAAILDRLLDRWPDQPDRRSTLEQLAADAIACGRAAGIAPIGWSDARYPSALAAIFDPPPVLWVRGAVSALDGPAVAIVGSRAGSPYALAMAERLAFDLASRGVIVVSGLARGVDSAAHRGALAAGRAAPARDDGDAGSVSDRGDADSNHDRANVMTVGVLASGADRIYPAEHAALARDIARRGAVVSENVPGTPPLPAFFPLRNRIISGLSRAVVVIEAGEKSGSLITARSALEQGREVLAVPGNALSGRNRGAHGLLRDGAKIVETADDILEELDPSAVRTASCRAGAAAQQNQTRPDDLVLTSMTPGEPADLDAICERSGLTAAKLLPRLFELEMQGLIARAGGGRFVRV